jgi:hypothetical protein
MAGFGSFTAIGAQACGFDYVRLVYRQEGRDMDAAARRLRREGWQARSLSLGSGRFGRAGEWRKVTVDDVCQTVTRFGAGRAFRLAPIEVAS